ncbi:hypothetical protein [Tranquillimonas alkanivorans]|uniref:hypothetical protein n=1 Tax=Tranquillimonas alkanivorans TaxID=441119 RepID=UPI001160B8DC|nr:hypothetical protein [Tranquillimonas alkanivorans]
MPWMTALLLLAANLVAALSHLASAEPPFSGAALVLWGTGASLAAFKLAVRLTQADEAFDQVPRPAVVRLMTPLKLTSAVCLVAGILFVLFL